MAGAAVPKSISKLLDFKLPLILGAEIILCLLFAHLIPPIVKETCYSLSLALKEVLTTLLPWIIFSILSSSLGALNRGAFLFTLLAFSLVIISNFTSTTLAGFLGVSVLDFLNLSETPHANGTPLAPLWVTYIDPQTWAAFTSFWGFKLLKSVSNDGALFAGIVGGLVLAITNYTPGKRLSLKLRGYAFAFFEKLFIPLIPVFILGYVISMAQEGILQSIFHHYLAVVAFIVLFVFTYISFLYALASGFQLKAWIATMRSLFPAMLTGFSTMSSASAMPLILEGVRKNTTNEATPGVVPISINIHLVGDCFSISILALAILVSFGHPLPTLEQYLVFAVYFVFAKFAVAAVPGGGIIVMIPILEKHLGFTPEMASLITALYILFDPLITSANVFGNGAFAQVFERLYQRLSPKKKTK